jgi:hypothetical protein
MTGMGGLQPLTLYTSLGYEASKMYSIEIFV